MQTIKNIKGVKTIIFAKTFEQEALEQVKKLSNFEAYQDSKIRIMPDAHAGKGCTIGTTMTITDKVTPNLVGVDIGCGMLTVKLKNQSINLHELDEVIKENIPSGFNVHKKGQGKFDFSRLRCRANVDINRAMLSIGTLGGGNHFIEIGRGDVSEDVYLIIHSGSRKFGSEVCKYYQDKAIRNAKEMKMAVGDIVKKLKAEGREAEKSSVIENARKPLANRDLSFLKGDDFDDYMNDMKIAQDFASLNRHTMADTIIAKAGLQEENRLETIHNYIDFKRMILRKGAISAEDGELVLIPINMRDGSLLCVGKGNENWNYSAPHGAGRLMSRRRAKQSISLDCFVDSMSEVHTTSVYAETLDEAPQAYKDIDEIKSAIVDTVDVIETIKPLYNFKAH